MKWTNNNSAYSYASKYAVWSKVTSRLSSLVTRWIISEVSSGQMLTLRRLILNFRNRGGGVRLNTAKRHTLKYFIFFKKILSSMSCLKSGIVMNYRALLCSCTLCGADQNKYLNLTEWRMRTYKFNNASSSVMPTCMTSINEFWISVASSNSAWQSWRQAALLFFTL
jgi:hypothetical protein